MNGNAVAGLTGNEKHKLTYECEPPLSTESGTADVPAGFFYPYYSRVSTNSQEIGSLCLGAGIRGTAVRVDHR